MTDELPPFPVDEATLQALEHAMGGALTFDRPDDADPLDDGPWLKGADYSLSTLLDFVGGTYDHPDLDPEDNPAMIRRDDIGGIACYEDIRVHYSEHDVIRSLIAEVRRLRAEVPEQVAELAVSVVDLPRGRGDSGQPRGDSA